MPNPDADDDDAIRARLCASDVAASVVEICDAFLEAGNVVWIDFENGHVYVAKPATVEAFAASCAGPVLH
jgi:hypothetical protein